MSVQRVDVAEFEKTLTGPVRDLVSVTPNDSTDLASGVCRAIFVNVSGDVSLITPGGTTVTLTLAAGVIHPICAVRIRSTGTDATGIFAGY